MPTVNVTYNLPEEQEEYNTHMRGPDYFCIIWDTLQEMRSVCKYGKEGFNAEEADKWRTFIWEQINEHGVGEDF